MVEIISAEQISEAVNEAIREAFRQSAETLAAKPTAWEKIREFIRVWGCGNMYDDVPLDYEEMKMIDEMTEMVKAEEMESRMERAYKELGIESAEELESRQFLTPADIEKTSAYRYMKEQLNEGNVRRKLTDRMSMEEFVQKAAKGEL